MNFFIISAQRSGSTLLRLLINSNPGFSVPQETHLFKHRNFKNLQYSRKFYENTKLEGLKIPEKVSLDRFISLNFNNNDIIGDKTPENIDNLRAIREYYPEAKFVLLFRSPVQIFLSLENRGWQGPTALNRYIYIHKCIAKMQKLNSTANTFLVDYEKMVTHTEDVLRDIFSFLGLETAHDIIKNVNINNVQAFELETGIHKSLSNPISVHNRNGLLSPKLSSLLNKIWIKNEEDLQAFHPYSDWVYNLNDIVILFFNKIARLVPKSVINKRRKYRRNKR